MPEAGTPMRRVATTRLTLEPQVAAHADEMFVVLGDPAIYEYENEPPQSLEGLRERFAELERRWSPNGRERWLNWVIRLPSSQLIGYVQATVYPDGHASVAYELCSTYWGLGLGSAAVQAMMDELAVQHGVRRLTAVLKRENRRSLRLLQGLGFLPASAEAHEFHQVERDEYLMQRELAAPQLPRA